MNSSNTQANSNKINCLQKTVTLGQETINTPLYAQLDPNHCHIMTEQLQRYAVIGQSVPGSRAIKVLRLAAFAPATPPSMDYNIRVYVIEDTQDALEVIINTYCRAVHIQQKKYCTTQM